MLLGLIVILMAALWTEALLPPEDEEENVLHIGGIFPVAGEGGWQGGQVRESSTSFRLKCTKNRVGGKQRDDLFIH